MKESKKKDIVSFSSKSLNDDFTNFSLQTTEYYVGLQSGVFKKTASLLMKTKGVKREEHRIGKI